MSTYITQLPLPSLPDGDFSTIVPLFRPTTSNSQQETTPLPPTYHSAPLNPSFLDPTAPAPYHPSQFIHNHPTSTSTSNGYIPTQPTYPNPDFTTLPAHHQYHHHQQQQQYQYHHQPPRPTPSATARRWLTRINTIQQSELGASPPLAQLSQGTGSSPSSSDTTTTTTNSGPSSPTGGVGGGGGGGGHSRTSSGSGVAGVSPRQLQHQHQHQRRRVAKQRERERQSGDLDHRGLMGGFRVLWHR